MELKPTRDKAARPRLDGRGNPVPQDMAKNPFGMLARALEPVGNRRRRGGEVLGATPPRDGPFAAAARGVAIVNPPKSRQRRRANPGLPFSDE